MPLKAVKPGEKQITEGEIREEEHVKVTCLKCVFYGVPMLANTIVEFTVFVICKLDNARVLLCFDF